MVLSQEIHPVVACFLIGTQGTDETGRQRKLVDAFKLAQAFQPTTDDGVGQRLVVQILHQGKVVFLQHEPVGAVVIDRRFDEAHQFGVFGKPGVGNHRNFAVGQGKLVFVAENQRPQFNERNLELAEAHIGVDVEPVAALPDGNGQIRVAQKIAAVVFGVLAELKTRVGEGLHLLGQPRKRLRFGQGHPPIAQVEATVAQKHKPLTFNAQVTFYLVKNIIVAHFFEVHVGRLRKAVEPKRMVAVPKRQVKHHLVMRRFVGHFSGFSKHRGRHFVCPHLL